MTRFSGGLLNEANVNKSGNEITHFICIRHVYIILFKRDFMLHQYYVPGA